MLSQSISGRLKSPPNDINDIPVFLLKCCEFIFHLLQISLTVFVGGRGGGRGGGGGAVVRTQQHPLCLGHIDCSRD